MILRIALFVSFLIVSGDLALAQQLIYKVDLKHTVTHKVGVEIDLKKCGAQTVTYQMPVWAPGAYSVTHYGHYVTDLKAFDTKGNPLKVTSANGDRWEIADAKSISKITYSVGDSHQDSTSLYFALAHITENFFFANGTCLFGYVNDKKNISSEVIYDFPESWKLSTALTPAVASPSEYYSHPDFKHTSFDAKNYDELADGPVMAGPDFQIRTFQEGKAWYDIVVASDKPFPMDSLADNIRKIAHAETEFFHDTPFDHYTFLINAPTESHTFSYGQGALEHANSSAYLLVNYPWSVFKRIGVGVLSHEFFHLWNVKRIHSSLLGPFDYTKRVMTTSLWLSEGITDYYAHTILTRWNIAPYRNFELMLGELLGAIKQSKAAQTKNLEELSIAESDFDLTNALVFYSKGTIVGLMLDIEIRSRTNNKKSLDDVMFVLNADAKKGKTFKDNELITKIEKITGLDLQDFYKKYIAGTDTLPIDEYLKKMGMGRHVVESEEKPSIGGDIKKSKSGEFYIGKVTPGGTLDKNGVMVGDTMKTLNGETFSLNKAMELAAHLVPPATVEFDVSRPHVGIKHFSVTVDKALNNAFETSFVGDNFFGSLVPTQSEVHPGDQLRFVFYRTPPDSPLPDRSMNASGIEAGDTLVMVNGEEFTMDKYLELSKKFNPPATYDLTVGRASGRKKLAITYDKPRAKENLDAAKQVIKDFGPLPDATPLEVEIRHGIVGRGY